MKKPFPYYGGKDALAPFLVSLLPPHQVYVEVFGGSAALLFAKQRSPLEIYNDLDSGLVNFFRVVRDREKAQELQRMLQLTPYAREEYRECRTSWTLVDDPLEQARRWYVGVVMSMNGSMRTGGWSSTKEPGSNPARKWTSHISRLMDVSERLAEVQVDHRDFADVLRAYDSPKTLFYLDPPYLPESRTKPNCYAEEMTFQDHERLLSILPSLQGMTMLSGYAPDLYNCALNGWDCIRHEISCSAAGRTHGTGMQGEGVILASQMRTECLWRNQAAVGNLPSLWTPEAMEVPPILSHSQFDEQEVA